MLVGGLRPRIIWFCYGLENEQEGHVQDQLQEQVETVEIKLLFGVSATVAGGSR